MSNNFLLPLIKQALAEDVGSGDLTSILLIPQEAMMECAIVARESMVLCGIDVPSLVYQELGSDIQITRRQEEGAMLDKGAVIATISGKAANILTGERVMLNIMQRLSGVATLTQRYVKTVAGTGTKILDTRKTMPGLRHADKYAVTVGGGVNHRMGLYDAVMVKDNHIASTQTSGQGLAVMIEQARAGLAAMPGNQHMAIYVECDNLNQLQDVLPARPTRIMLDNMPLEDLREAVRIVSGTIPLEATGGITLANVRAVAETGVDCISVGAITHSAVAVDIGLDYSNPSKR